MPAEAYNPEIAEEILVRMRCGESVRSICSDPEHPEFPCRKTVERWAARDTDGFADRYAHAYLAGVQSRIENAADIAEEIPTFKDTDGVVRIDAAGIQRNKLRCEQARWDASHLLRGSGKLHKLLDYGDKTEISGEMGIRTVMVASPVKDATPRPEPKPDFES